MTSRDYLDQYRFLGGKYLTSENVQSVKLTEDSMKYIEKIYDRFLVNNEIIFDKKHMVNFYIIKDEAPFLFCLPGEQYFFSSGLFIKYLKSEEVFVAAFSAEVLKSKRSVFEKKSIIPLGFMSTEKMIYLTRINLEYKKELNQWAYTILKRSGYDASAYLNWIQVQNRNNLDFSLYLGDSMEITKEEQAFKNFMSKQGIVSVGKKASESNSSKEYYKLLKDIEKGVYETRAIRKNPSRGTF